MNKFEQVSSDHHQMPLAGGPGLISRGDKVGGGLYKEIQCIVGNPHMLPPGENDGQT